MIWVGYVASSLFRANKKPIDCSNDCCSPSSPMFALGHNQRRKPRLSSICLASSYSRALYPAPRSEEHQGKMPRGLQAYAAE